MAPTIISGVCPVLETPFTARGEVDEKSFRQLIEHVYAAGVRSVMFPGYASEFLKLVDEERVRLTDILLDAAKDLPGLSTVISVPDHATRVAAQRAVEAVASGAHAINVLPPYLLGPSAEAVRAHVLEVARAVDSVPVIVQYAPAQTGASLDAGTLAALATEAPNIVQVKVESVPAGGMISALSRQTPQLAALAGYGGVQLIDALQRGAVGVQPGSSFVELYVHIWDDWIRGERKSAVAMHTRMLPYLSYWMQNVELIVAAEKRISMLRGIIEDDYCRAPGYRLDARDCEMIDSFLADFAGELANEGSK